VTYRPSHESAPAPSRGPGAVARVTAMSEAPHHVPAAHSPVLLVVTGGAISRAAIARAARLAAGAPVTVVGVAAAGPAGDAAAAECEQVRRAVALAMSLLENTGVVAFGQIAVTGSPARALARAARARGARVVVLDQPGGLAAELRRRVYGSGILVVCATERGGRRP
jgi:hypothetical protein